MRLTAVLIFLLAFQIEVRVHADSVLEPVGEPEHCWTKSAGACSVQAGTKPLVLKSDAVELWAGGESLLSREGKSPEWRFLKGSVRARTEKTGHVAFPQGEVTSEDGEFWILEDGERFVVRAVRGPVTIKTRDARALEVPEGLEVWVGGYLASGAVSHGVPSLISIEDHLKRWGALGDVPASQFVKEARELRDRWKERTAVAAALYDQVSKRHLASVKAEEDRLAAARHAEQERRAQNRAMLMDRAFGR